MTTPPTSSALRLLVVIDGTNFWRAANPRGHGVHLRYRQLAIEIAKHIVLPPPQRWELQRIVYVTAPPNQAHDRLRYERWRKFETMILQQKVELRLGRLEGPKDRVYEKGVDILVAIELLAGALKNTYDLAVIVAGDGDYADVAKEVRAAGKTIYNAFFGASKSYELSAASNGFIDIEGLNWSRLKIVPPASRPHWPRY